MNKKWREIRDKARIIIKKGIQYQTYGSNNNKNNNNKWVSEIFLVAGFVPATEKLKKFTNYSKKEIVIILFRIGEGINM